MNNWFDNKYLLVALLSAFLSVPALTTAAIGKDKTEVKSMKITFSDLDLSREEGIETLYQRLKSGASKVCGTKNTHVTGSRVESSKTKNGFKRCYAKALNSAVQSINNTRLTDIHSNNS